jgi:hypothetical protein
VYKKNIRIILVIFGFLIAVCMNLDTIHIAQDSLSNKQVLNQTVDKIVSQLPGIKMANDSLAPITIKTTTGEITIAQGTAAKNAKADSTLKQNVKAVSDLKVYMQTSGISVGYADWNAFKKKWTQPIGDLLLSLLGVLITTFALQMSSNFWFDLMNKAVNIRAAGKKPDNGKDKDS